MKVILSRWVWLLIASIHRINCAVADTRRLRVATPSRRERPLALAVEDRRSDQAPKMPEAHNPFIPLKEGSKKRMMNAINKFRAEICYRMKVENGVDFGTFENCEKFMRKACRPGGDDSMDGDRKEITSGEGYCREFFPEAEEKAKKQIEEEDKEAEAEAEVQAPAPAAATPPGIVAPAPAPETPAAIKEQKASKAVSPAPAQQTVAVSPAAAAAAPMQPKFTPGISKGKPTGDVAGDEAYYYKKGGKDPFRLHMDEDLKLPTQGYWGKLVSHDDMETATGDWGVEFGSKAGHGTYESHCRKYCDNEWCIRQGYCGYGQRSSGVTAFISMLSAMVVLVTATFFL